MSKSFKVIDRHVSRFRQGQSQAPGKNAKLRLESLEERTLLSTFPNNLNPPSLPPPSGTIIHVDTTGELQSAVANLKSGQTILIDPGTYNLTSTLWVPQGVQNISIRGTTGNRSDVIINGQGMSARFDTASGSAIPKTRFSVTSRSVTLPTMHLSSTPAPSRRSFTTCT